MSTGPDQEGSFSPDLPTPVSLALHDVDENDLVDSMIAALQVNIPEWVPQEGATEIMLMETLALVMGQQIYALNQLPRVVLDGLIALRGFERKPAVPAAGTVNIVMAASTLGTRTLPVGARFRVPTDNDDTVDMLAAETLALNPADSLTATVNVVADIAGTVPNGIPPGVAVSMVDAYTWVESAVVSSVFGGGGDLETDDAFYARVAAAFQSLSSTYVIDSQFAMAALSVTGVGRARGYGLWDGVGAIGTVPGHVTVGVAGPDGANVSTAVKDAVTSLLVAGSVAGLTIHVIDFTKVAMNLTISYSLTPGYVAATTTAAIESTLRAWLNPATWPFTETLTSVNQIVLRIGTVPGVDNVISITGLASVTGGSSLPVLGTVTISVV